MNRRDALLLLLLAAVWGASYPLTTVALRDMSTPWVVLTRTGTSALLLIPVAATRGVLAPLRHRTGSVLSAALLQATFPLVLLTAGQEHVSAGLAGVLAGTQPIFVAVLTMASGHARQPRQIAGVLLGFAGIVLLFTRDLGTHTTTVVGGLLVVGSAAFFATGAVYIHHALPDIAPLAVAGIAMATTTIALAPVAAATTTPEHLTPTDAVSLIVLGAVCTGAALVVFYHLIHRIGPTDAALAFYLAPAAAVIYSALFLAERPTPTVLAGLVLIIASAVMATRPTRTTRSYREQS